MGSAHTARPPARRVGSRAGRADVAPLPSSAMPKPKPMKEQPRRTRHRLSASSAPAPRGRLTRLRLGPRQAQLTFPSWVRCPSEGETWGSDGATLPTVPASAGMLQGSPAPSIPQPGCTARLSSPLLHEQHGQPLPVSPQTLCFAPSSPPSGAGAVCGLPDVHGYIGAACNPFFF